MFAILDRISATFQRIPHDLIAIVARIGIGTTFFRSGLLKVEGWNDGTTLALFKNEYKLPLLPPELAAYIATAAELSLPMLIFSGLLTRLSAFGLLIMTLVIQIFVYPNAFDTHGVWAVALAYLMKYGPGRASVDHLVFSRDGARHSSHVQAAN